MCGIMNYFGDARTIDTHVKKIKKQTGRKKETISRRYGGWDISLRWNNAWVD